MMDIRFGKERETIMKSMDSIALARNLNIVLSQAVTEHRPTCVRTESGNAVILSEQEYDSLVETIILFTEPDMDRARTPDASGFLFEPLDLCSR